MHPLRRGKNDAGPDETKKPYAQASAAIRRPPRKTPESPPATAGSKDTLFPATRKNLVRAQFPQFSEYS